MHWLAFLGAAVAGVGGPFIGIPTVTAIQIKAASSSTGKIFAINMLIFTFFSMLSSSLGAIWLGSWPVEQLFFINGLFLAAMSATGFLSTNEIRANNTNPPLCRQKDWCFLFLCEKELHSVFMCHII